jgi:serine/threonine protein kinase
MDTPKKLERLQTLEWDQLQSLADQFESAWRKSDMPDLNPFLPPADSPLRLVALQELIKVDLEMCWRNGQDRKLEQYLGSFPELGTIQTLEPRLIYEEYRVRRRYGDRPELSSYEQRFPDQFPQVRQIIEHEVTRHEVTRLAEKQFGLFATEGSVLPFGGGYKLSKRLGGGGFAEVYAAEAPGGVHVAVKQLKQSMDAAEAQHELRALELVKNLRHPHLLQTHAFFLWEGRLFIIMELADGTLRDRLKIFQKKGTGIPLAELLKYLREAAAGLDFLHENQILHRDIKPENILLLQGYAKLGDLGLARLTQSLRLSITGGFGGTPFYIAPEAWSGDTSEFSDQYALAMTYAELRRGTHPFEGRRGLHEIMFAHAGGVPDLSPMPEAEQAVVRKALAKEPHNRYPYCKDFVRALEEATAPELRRTNPELFRPLLSDSSSTRESRGSNVHTTLTDLEDGLGEVLPRRQDSEDKTPLWHRTPPPPPPTTPVGILLLVAAMVTVLGVVLWQRLFHEPVSSFKMIEPPPLSLRAGTTQPITLQVQRFDFEGPIHLSFSGLPPGINLASTTIPGDAESVQVIVKTDPDARGGKVRVLASTGQSEQEVFLELAVDASAYKLPKDWVRAPEARLEEIEGKFYYDKIDVIRGKILVRFLLVAGRKKLHASPFYIMEDKVWVDLFQEFARGRELKNKHWEDFPSNKKNAEYPVMGVVVGDAHDCADWLGGKLPLPEQWDLAAGRYDEPPREGPFQGKWDPNDPAPQIAINRNEPMARGKASRDVSPHGCRDMSGNGLEWTRRLASKKPGDDSLVCLKPPDPNYNVVLRGCRYSEEAPLRFRDLDADPARGPGQEKYANTNGNPQIGFRVVLEP